MVLSSVALCNDVLSDVVLSYCDDLPCDIMQCCVMVCGALLIATTTTNATIKTAEQVFVRQTIGIVLGICNLPFLPLLSPIFAIPARQLYQYSFNQQRHLAFPPPKFDHSAHARSSAGKTVTRLLGRVGGGGCVCVG